MHSEAQQTSNLCSQTQLPSVLRTQGKRYGEPIVWNLDRQSWGQLFKMTDCAVTRTIASFCVMEAPVCLPSMCVWVCDRPSEAEAKGRALLSRCKGDTALALPVFKCTKISVPLPVYCLLPHFSQLSAQMSPLQEATLAALSKIAWLSHHIHLPWFAFLCSSY